MYRTLLLATVVALASHLAWSAPPPVGSEDWRVMEPYREEIRGLHVDGVWCCDWADGRPVEARRAGGAWQVRFRADNGIGAPGGVWLDVKGDAVAREANPVGVPIAWWRGGLTGFVACFWPGVEG